MKQKLQVWWVPQVPMKSFKVEVDSVAEGVKIMDILANYDLFQYKNRVKPDYANMGGLNIWNEEEQEYWSWDIDIDDVINGVGYCEYFDDPKEYLEFLKENNLTEKDIEKELSKGGK